MTISTSKVMTRLTFVGRLQTPARCGAVEANGMLPVLIVNVQVLALLRHVRVDAFVASVRYE